MDRELLGARIAAARDGSGWTQQALASAVGLERSALSKIEAGTRKVEVSELLVIAGTLQLPLAYFVKVASPSVVSRRQDTFTDGASVWALDTALQLFSGDVLELQTLELLATPKPRPELRTPRSHEDAELAAEAMRRAAGLARGPIADLGRTCDSLGMHTFVGDFGAADGGFVVVDTASPSLGVAAVNGGSDPGRRRMTLAHELGHWTFGDAYDRGADWNEIWIRSFAVHFLAPRASVITDWRAHEEWTVRDRALLIGAVYRLSWSATVGQLANLNLISSEEHESLIRHRPRKGDYLRLGLDLVDDLVAPYVSPAVSKAAITGYETQRLTAARTIEILRGTLQAEELPERPPLPYTALSSSLSGHDR